MPARHRELLAAMGVNQLTVTKHPEGSLLIFPRPAWEHFRDRVAALPMDSSGWKRVFLGNAMDVDIDASSRVLSAPELRAAAAELMAGQPIEPAPVVDLVDEAASRLRMEIELDGVRYVRDGTKLTAHDAAFSLTSLKAKGHPLIIVQMRDMVSLQGVAMGRPSRLHMRIEQDTAGGVVLPAGDAATA